MSLEGGKINTFKLLDRFIAVLDPATNNMFFWPFFESTGIDIQSYKDIDEPLLAGEATAYVELNDPATGFAPYKHVGGVYSYHFEGADDQHLEGADVATLSFNGTADTVFSIGCFFYAEAATGTLIAKYDAVGGDREWRLHLLAGPDLALEVFHEDGVDSSETAQTTTALSTRRWYFGLVTYGGAGGDGGGGKLAAADMNIYVDGSLVAKTTSEVGAAYADMIAGNAPLMIGANDDNAAPANEFTGRIALPFIVNAELSAANAVTLNNIGKTLLGV